LQTKKVEDKEKESVEKFMEELEDCEDVNDYYNNCEF
jgi:transcriptional/translational regulatory protein YebC/TACO1